MKTGRPTKFNKSRADSIIEAIAKFVPYTMVADAHQIDRSTLYDWINKGLEDLKNGHKTTLARFSYTLKKRECEGVCQLLDDVKEGVKSWQSRAWILERRFPMDFALGAQELTQLRQELEDIKNALKDG